MLLFEDIHWADASQLDLLEMLASRVRDVPVLFVALARPELLADRPTWGGGLPAYTSLQLDPLSETSSQELAEQLLAAGRSRRRCDRGRDGGGKPAVHRGARGVDRGEVVCGPASDQRPGDHRGAARLPPARRAERLVDASVAGRVFWRGALAEMGGHDDLATSLSSLEDRA